MKTKIIIISIVLTIITGVFIIEMTYVKSTLADISESSKQIIEQIQNDNQKQPLLDSMNTTYTSWKNSEYNLCFLYNHKDLLEVGKELNQAISYVEQDNNTEAYIHMLLLQEDLRALCKLNKQGDNIQP